MPLRKPLAPGKTITQAELEEYIQGTPLKPNSSTSVFGGHHGEGPSAPPVERPVWESFGFAWLLVCVFILLFMRGGK